jgi:hypothetical protein
VWVKQRAATGISFALIVILASFALQNSVAATQLTRASIRLGRLGPSATVGNDALVTFKLNTTPTSVAKIAITLPSGFNITAGSPTPAITGFPNTPASITAPPGTLTSTATSSGTNLGGTITVSGLTSASLTATTLYGFIIPTGTVQNPATGATQYNITVTSQNSGGTAIDTTTTPVYITSAIGDQVVVSGSVAPSFSFSLSANTDTIPKVDPTTIQTSGGVTMAVSTNSPLGYTAYVKSATNSLTSATSPATPICTGSPTCTNSFDGAPDTIAAGTTKYGFVPTTGTACTSCTGSLTYDPEYAIADGTHSGGFNGTSFASFVSRNGYTNSDQITLKERDAVANTIGYANDYTDTLTIVAAGNY